MKRSVAIVMFLAAWGSAMTAQTNSALPADRDALMKGDPPVDVVMAEKNLYPSPGKVLALKEQLGLTKDQVRKIEELINNSVVSATVKGSEIIEAEEGLGQLFETGTMNERTLRAKLERIGKLRSDYCFVHLQTYLKVKQILSPNQYERYKELVKSETK
jgi:hypothetical protein